jgi:hypothetical protein
MRETAWQCGDISRKRGGTEEGKEMRDDASWVDTNLIGLKNEENQHG